MSDRTIESLEASEAMRKEIERLRVELAEKDAAIAQAYEDGRISACNAGKPGCPRAAASEAELAAVRALMDTYNVGGWTDAIEPMKRALAAEAECARLRDALGWYGEEAKAIAKHMAKGARVAAGAILASVTVLSLDGGRRADAAIAASKPKEPKP